MVDVAHDRDHGWTTDQVLEIARLNHFHGLLGRRFDVVFENGHPEFVGNGFDRGQIKGLGHRGDDALEEQGFDDFGAFDAQPVCQLLNREVALWNNQHFGTLSLGLPGRPQLHRPTTLTLAGGFLFALADRHGRLGRRGGAAAGLGGSCQARLKH